MKGCAPHFEREAKGDNYEVAYLQVQNWKAKGKSRKTHTPLPTLPIRYDGAVRSHAKYL